MKTTKKRDLFTFDKIFSCLAVVFLLVCTKNNNPFGQSPETYQYQISFASDTIYTYIQDTITQRVFCPDSASFRFIWLIENSTYDTTRTSTFNHCWSDTGHKNIIVWAIDENGRKTSESNSFSVIVKSGTPVIYPLRDTACFVNDSLTFQVHATDENGYITKYLWAAGTDSTYTSGDSVFTFSYKTPGQIALSLKVVDEDSVQSEPVTCRINVLEGKPVIRLGAVQNCCIRDTVRLSATSHDTNGTVVRYVWHYTYSGSYKTDTLPPFPPNSFFEIIWPDTGKKTVILSAIDDDGIVSIPDTCILTISYGPRPVVNVINDTNCYINDTLLVTATGTDSDGTISSYIWSVNSFVFKDTTSTGSKLFIWSGPGKPVVRVRAIDNDGQLSEIDSCIVNVKAGHPVSTAASDTTVSVACNCAVSRVLQVYDENLSTPGITWFIDTGSTAGWDYQSRDSIVSFSKPEGGILRVIWKACDDDSNFTSTDTFNITFNRLPVCTLKTPVDTADWQVAPSSMGKGSVIFKWNGSDPDGSSDIFSYSFYLGKKADSLQLQYSGLLTSDTISDLDTLTQYFWKVIVKDNFKDSALVSGTFVTQYGPPAINQEPDDTIVFKNDTVLFNISATGHDVHYKWFKNDTLIDSLHSVLTINTVDYSDNASTCRCIVSNRVGADTSRSIKITVKPRIPVVDSIAPIDTTVLQRTNVKFRVFVSADSLKYQWQSNNVNIESGGNDSVYLIDSTKLSDNGASFRCIISNSSGADTSRNVLLTVNIAPPVIISHPVDTSAGEGSRVRMKVAAFGDSLKYQWQKDSVDIETGENSDSLVIASASFADAGGYRCVVSNSAGTLISSEAVLRIDSVYILTISAGTGGTVTPSAEQKLTSVTQCSVSATPNTGYIFTGWTIIAGNPTIENLDSANTTVSTSENATIRANFTIASYNLTISSSTGGSTEPAAGILTLNHGVPQSIKATPSSGYYFSGWSVVSGNATFASSSAESTTVSITGNASIRANFTALTYTLSVSSTTGGTTIPSGATTVSHGVARTITATPYSGYAFVSWGIVSGSATFTDTSLPSTSVSITGNTTIRANFRAVSYTLTINSSAGGSTSPSGNVSLSSGASRTISATPSSSLYVFKNWTITSGTPSIGNSSSASTTVSVIGNAAIQANFDIAPPTITTDLSDEEEDEDNTVSYSIVATGLNLTYQWKQNDNNVGTNTNTFSFTATPFRYGDEVYCIVSNSAGSVTSKKSYLIVYDSRESDDNPLYASTIVANGSSQRHTLTEDDEDWMTFYAVAGNYYTIQTTGDLDTYLELYNSSTASTPGFSDDDGGSDYNAEIVLPCLGTGYFWIRVLSEVGDEGHYSISVTSP